MICGFDQGLHMSTILGLSDVLVLGCLCTACEAAVYDFLESFLGVQVPDHPDPASSPMIDWIYAMAVAVLAMVIFVLAALLNDELLISLQISPDEELRVLG